MHRGGVTEPAHPSTGEQEGPRPCTARNGGERAAPGAPRKSSRHLGGPRLRPRTGRRTGVGSGWQGQAAQPSGWDQALQTTSITPPALGMAGQGPDTQREACGTLWGVSFPAPAREEVGGGEGCGSVPSRSCFQPEGRGWGPLHGGVHVLTHVCELLRDSHICDLGVTGELGGHLSEDLKGLALLLRALELSLTHHQPTPNAGRRALGTISSLDYPPPQAAQCPHHGLPTLGWTPCHAQPPPVSGLRP